jgi:hypothetical protein
VLDQLWLSFDVARTVFVTAGRQHAKWGTGHFWNPTDYLHPVRRDPLALFDSRTGATMLRLHLPWEKRGWNFYGVALLEGAVQGGTQLDAQTAGGGTGTTPSGTYGNADRLGKVAGAARAELVFGSGELGLDAIVRRGSAKGGVDFSAGIWDLDVYGELAVKTGSDAPLFELIPGASATDYLFGYRPRQVSGLTPAATLGASWSWKYSDEDAVTIGGEYFYNANGYEDPLVYPYLIYQQFATGAATFTPFYLGKQYGGLFVLLPRPGSWNDTNFTLSTLGNLSDRSFISRLDFQVTALTYLRFEAYGQAHYGNGKGEFRLGIDVPSFSLGTQSTPAIHLTPPTFDVGLSLRVGI